MIHEASCKRTESKPQSNSTVIDAADRFSQYAPDDPRRMRLAQVERDVSDGLTPHSEAKVIKAIFGQLLPDRHGNLRTIRPLTHAAIAVLSGVNKRSLERKLPKIRQRYDWFNWLTREGGNIFKMQIDGRMIGKKVVSNMQRCVFPKETTKKESSVGKRTLQTVVVEDGGKSAPPVPVVARLASWLEALSPDTIGFATAKGLSQREVLATAERFARWYTAHPDRVRGDIDQQFRWGWLPRDVAHKAEARARRERVGDAWRLAS